MIARHELISSGYLELQQELHARPNGYGGRGEKWADVVLAWAERLGASSILDYGCGQGSLKVAIDRVKPAHVIVREYDPAIPGKDRIRDFADLVVCTDVLEHVEPDRLTAVLRHIQQIARLGAFVVVALRPSNKTMADGRNAHLITESAEWWIARCDAAGCQVDVCTRQPGHELSLLLTHRGHPCG